MSSKNPTILERIDMVEKASDQIWKLFETNFGEVRKTLAGFSETIQALIKVGGPDFEAKVVAALHEIKLARFEAEYKRSQAILDQLLDNKVIEAGDVLTENSIVVARYLNKQTGELEEPGYQQFEASSFLPAAKEACLGQGVGFVYVAPESVANFEILGVYNYTKNGGEVAVTETTPEAVVAADDTNANLSAPGVETASTENQ